MKPITAIACLFALALPAAATADIASQDLPAETVWYAHVDLERMRTTGAGQEVYNWLQDEVILDINDELKIDLNREVDRVTAFSQNGSGIIAVIEGRLSQDLRDQVMELGDGDFEEFRHSGKSYFHAGNEDGSTRINRHTDIEHSGYFTFDFPGKLILASEEPQIQALIDNGGEVPGTGVGGMLVLSAEQEFVQAGMRPDRFADDEDDDGWKSNILRNTEQWALLISDQNGMLAVSAKMLSTDPEMAESLASIVNGVIALQAFNADLEPEFVDVLRNTRVTANGNELSISSVLSPEMLVKTLND